MKCVTVARVFFCAYVLTAASDIAKADYPIEWTKGTQADRLQSVAVSQTGNVFVSGHDAGGPATRNNASIAKLDSSGAILWERLLSSAEDDFGWSIDVDHSENSYIAGFTNGSLAGANAGGADGFVAKYDSIGTNLWTRQFGTSGTDRNWSIAVDSFGNAYVGGYTQGSLYGTNAGGFDATLSKFDPDGSRIWGVQFGSIGFHRVTCVDLDSHGNIFVGGDASNGAYVSKFDPSGQSIWSKQIGTPLPGAAWSIAVDESTAGIYVAGESRGAIASDSDAFAIKLDLNGNKLWGVQFATPEDDRADGIALDGLGNVFVGGSTWGSLASENFGSEDVFIATLSPNGALRWAKQLGTASQDNGWGVDVDASGSVFLAGDFRGVGTITKFAVPEPTSLTMCVVGMGAFVSLVYRSRRH